MKTLLLSLLCLIGTFTSQAAELEPVQAGKDHLKALLTGDEAALQKSYAAEVTLMPGHEFLKPEYGLAKDETRKDPVKVSNKDLIAAVASKVEERPKPPEEKLEAMLGTLRYDALASKEGDFAVDPSDKVATPDGKLHFTIVKDDVVLKVSPPKGDFLLLHLRKSEGKWTIVSEYLD